MSDKAKNILLGVLIVGLVSMTVAYAALSQTLTINGSAQVQGRDTTWHVRFNSYSTNAACPSGTNEFENSKAICTGGYATLAANSAIDITSDSTLATLPQVTLKAPGDKVVFRWKVENTGDVNAILTGKTNITLGAATWDPAETISQSQKDALINDISLSFTYADGTAITPNSDTLAKTTGAADLMVTIEYVKTQEDQVLPTRAVTFDSITAALVYGQDANN